MPRSLLPRSPARKALLAAALLAALLPLSAAAAAEPGTLTVQPRPVEDLKAVFATVESVRETLARTRIGGTVADLTVTEGDKVTVGQVIATVRDPKLPLQLAALDARIQALTAQQHQAELELGRARQLRSSGTGTQQRLDDAQAALDVARAQIAAMEAERSVVAQQLREGEVLAPAAGRILQVKVIAGAVVMPGEPVASIATDTYILRLRLPERHARFLKEGDPVLVGQRGLAPVALADPGATALARGAVRQVYPEMAGGQVIADASVSGLGDFFVGERVRVYVATGTRDAVVIPPDWLLRRFGTDFVRLADGTEVPVQAGGEIPTVGDRPGGLEILSGLKPGDVVVRPAGS
ncbi:efflux RND transporter periplasmic adaptor subunit [Azospirillum brasilense]|uniref:efflux RND transporter periplasmic adaptor subunit n=1 Tax=Azospirillum brasilense TaxID=192 RepID=UPI000E67DB1C|nr:efflux RND transporter periplasmic adaptor subunit [Azospirillum brasilense]NUB27717.1 efflux RND transporter periplasmic adaptor subunit [Azospirillum brasilense]NUB33813.1 efflux RND transporter periplasmic adaptor subunit [Azospirillum brasilense]RIW03201.1 efflux RND transporter periplasmic adaptor subunit [Azospirillum brasilense]